MTKKIESLKYFKIGINSIFCVTLFFLVLFIPSINDSSLVNSTINSKTIFLIKGLIVLFCFWLIQFLFKKTPISKLLISKIDIYLFSLVLYIICNRYFIQNEYSFSIRYIELIGLSFFHVIIRIISIKVFLWLLLGIIISGIIQAIYGNLQLLGYYTSNHSGFNLTGSFFNPGPYAGFLTIVFSIALGFYLFKEKVISYLSSNIKSKYYLTINTIIKYVFEYIPLIGIVSIIIVIPATQSRASWLAIIITSFFIFELRYQIIKKKLKQLTKVKKTFLIITTSLIIALALSGVYNLKKGSSDGRLFIWKISTKIIKDNPVFGVGFDRFKVYYMNAQAHYFAEMGETAEALVADNTYYAFNEFIQFITENGIVGFILLIVILYLILNTSTKKENKCLNNIVKTSLLSICVFAFFSYPMQILPIKLVIVVLLAILSSLNSEKIQLFKNIKTNFSKLLIKAIAVAGCLGITIISFKYINKVNASFKTWKYALESYQYGDYESAIQEYESAYPQLKSNGEFLMNYGKALSLYKNDKKAVEILEQAKKHLNTTIIETALGDSYKNLEEYNKAEIAYKHAENMIPVRFYPLYLQAKLYEESGQNEKAKVLAKKILNKKVKIPSTAIEEIKAAMKKLLIKKPLTKND